MQKLCDLAQVWESNKLDEDWQPRSIDDWQAILDGIGLVGSFWRIPTE